MYRLVFTALIIAAQVAQAQIGLPDVRLPALPQTPLPGVDRAVTSVIQANQTALQEVRRLQIRALISRNRDRLEADGNGAAMIRGELLAVAPADADLIAAQAAGFTVSRVRILEGLDSRIVVLQAPPGLRTQRALQRLRSLLPSGSFDFNHIYTQTAGADSEPVPASLAAGGEPAVDRKAPADRRQLRVGLIDSGVDREHAVFKDVPIHQFGCAGAAIPDSHGTAVASLMTGRSLEFHGAAAGAELFAADVFCGQPTGGAAEAIAAAFAWLVRERVPVINVSLVGPANVTLDAVVRMVLARGHLIVAAVGNDGPAAPPLYPASYPGVVGVTAVDARRNVLYEAGRGSQVKFAAPGADMTAAKSAQTFALVRGTSFAAPLVACLLAAQLPQPDTAAAVRAVAALAQTAIDLGARGPDPVYGYGLVGAELAPPPRLAGSRLRELATSAASLK